jgi:toxin-antitoxin system PIN domain toxin
MVVLDTNIFLYAVNSDSTFHKQATAVINEHVTRDFGLTLGIIYEFLRVATHRKVFPSPLHARDALSFIKTFTSNENCYVLLPTTSHFEILAQCVQSTPNVQGNLFHDVATVALMRENGVKRIITNDTDFLQFDDIEVLNPLRS